MSFVVKAVLPASFTALASIPPVRPFTSNFSITISPNIATSASVGYKPTVPLAKLMAEAESGKPNFTRLVETEKKHQIEEVGSRLRGLMPWLAANKIVDKANN